MVSLSLRMVSRKADNIYSISIHHLCVIAKSNQHSKSILYLDKDYCIVNKPENICIDGNDNITMEKITLNELNQLNNSNNNKIRHCHQLDKRTSGILVYGLNKKSTKKMNELIRKRKIIKIYYCIVNGHINNQIKSNYNQFILDFPISENQNNIKQRNIIANNVKEGRAAITKCIIKKIGYLNKHPVSLLKIYLLTGRKHQIRLHLANIGYPIVGDMLYSNYNSFDRMYLDSHKVIINLNKNKKIEVHTQSDKEFDELIIGKISYEYKENDVDLIIDNDKYYYSLLIPFIMYQNEKGFDVKLLLEKSMQNDRIFLDFICKSKLGNNGYCDTAQDISNTFLKQYPYFGDYLYQKSLFCPKEFMNNKIDDKTVLTNIKYLIHHLASNIRRNNSFHCSVLCEPYIIYFVPFKNDIVNNKQHKRDGNFNMHWISIDTLDMNNDISFNNLLQFVLCNESVRSFKWINESSISNLNLGPWTESLM